MEQHLLCQQKAKKTGFTFLAMALLGLGVGLLLAFHGNKEGLKVLGAMLTVFSGFATLGFLVYLVYAFNDKNFFPKYKVGDLVIISMYDRNGRREYEFSQYDDIINQIPQYTVKEIGECSYLLAPTNTENEVQEVRFSKYNHLYSIAEFKQKAKCC